MKVALLEDDKYQGQLVQLWLQAAGHECDLFDTGESLVEVLDNITYDIYILDWVLPGMSGDKVLSVVREKRGWDVPIIFVTQKDSEDDIVTALKSGADDYMVKPIKEAEMLARVEALGRRIKLQQEEEPALLEYGPYKLDLETRTLVWRGKPVPLTQKEFDLAAYLFKHLGEITERNVIMKMVWGTSVDLKTRTVDIHISRLRKKLGLNGEDGLRLIGIYNHGYRMEKIHKPKVQAKADA